MGSNVILGLAIGGAAVGIGFLVWRAQKAKQETKPPGTKEGCEAIAKAAGLPASVCDVAVPVVEDIIDFVGDIGDIGGEYREKDETNKRLNGEIEVPLAHAVRSCLDSSFSPLSADTGGMRAHLWGSVLKFKNGCVPFAGAPGWEKCAPGTQTMFIPGYDVSFGDEPDPFTGRANVDLRTTSALTGTGARYYADGRVNSDATTGQFAPGGAGGKCAALFPVPIPEGHRGFYVGGKPRTCPDGQVPDVKRSSGCVAIPTPTSDPVVDESGQQGSGYLKDIIGWSTGPRSSTFVDCSSDPNFILDHLPDGSAYCRRKRAGEP